MVRGIQPSDLRRLHLALAVISADPSFQTQLEHIRQQFQASTVGLDALRRNAGRLAADALQRPAAKPAGLWPVD